VVKRLWIWRRSEGVTAGLMEKFCGDIVVEFPDVKTWYNGGYLQ